MKVHNGSKFLYRRISGGPEFTREVSCELVVHKVEEDIRKERPHLLKIPFTVEVLYYDDERKDCAVTASVEEKLLQRTPSSSYDGHALERLDALKAKKILSDLEVAELLSLRAQVASLYALAGLSLLEFQKYTKEDVSIIEGKGLCTRSFPQANYSVHGPVQVCWEHELVKGYCSSKTGQCWIRSVY
jgi:hypothetical protein